MNVLGCDRQSVRATVQPAARVAAVLKPPEAIQAKLIVGQGPSGPKGDTGSAGPGGGVDLSYVHNQGSASSTWLIVHNLGKYPSFSVVDSAGDLIEGDPDWIDLNTLQINFSAAFSGRAYLN